MQHYHLCTGAMALVTLGAAAALSGCGPSTAASSAAAPVLPTVTVVHPEKSRVQDFLDYTVRIEPSQRVEVRSRVAGYLLAIPFRDGQQVKAGDALFVIDQRPFAAARDRAHASLAQARARQKLAAAQLERITRLQRAGAASTEELDRASAEFDGAHAAGLLAGAELRSAALELSYTTIRAPLSGTISDRRVDVGNYLAGGAAQGGVLTTIVAHDPVRAVVELTEADLRRLRQHPALPAQVQVSLDGVAAARTAKVDFLDNEISARSGTVRLRATLDNAGMALMPGNFARVRIPLGQPQTRLLVPDAAVQSDQTRKLVMVVVNGKVTPKRVELGTLVGGRQVVLSGLAEQDRVIVSGAQRVRPGDRVQVAPAVNGS